MIDLCYVIVSEEYTEIMVICSNQKGVQGTTIMMSVKKMRLSSFPIDRYIVRGDHAGNHDQSVLTPTPVVRLLGFLLQIANLACPSLCHESPSFFVLLHLCYESTLVLVSQLDERCLEFPNVALLGIACFDLLDQLRRKRLC